jgi:hypothetical protein
MTTSIKFNDCRANRNYCFGQYQQICNDVVKSHTGQDREFNGGTMDWNYFKATSWKKNWSDVQVEVFMDFRTHEITITTID